MAFEKDKDVFDNIRRQSDKTGIDIVAAREVIFQEISSHPWKLITAKDYDGSPILRTKDEKDKTGQPFKPYPYQREYLKHMVYTLMDPDITMLWISKNRQIMASHTALIVALWKIHNLPAQNIFVSRIRQKDSVKALRDKVRQTHILFPRWLKERWTLSAEPKDMAISGMGSMITAVPQTFAEGEARGDSASEILVDEYAYQDHLANIITASMEMTKRSNFISTPNGTTIGGAIGQKYIKRAKDNAVLITNPCEGLNIIRAKMDNSSATLCVFEVIHRSEEQSSKGWLYVNESSRKQEQELSWEHTDGTAYFPEVEVYGGRDVYAKTTEELNINYPIERGYDFGVMRPACVWAQVDPVNVKIHVVRAILGKDIDPWSFAALVKYLSGELPYVELTKHIPAIHALNEIREMGMPEDPWFNRGFKFRDWGGHEAARPIASGPGEKIQTYSDIFSSFGLNMRPTWVAKERREYILRNLLKPREVDKIPGILVDPRGAPLVLNGIAGGLVRPYNMKSKEIRTEEPMDDHYFKDVYDALGYILVGNFDHIDWSGIKTTAKGLIRESIPFDMLEVNRLKRWGDTESVRQPLVSPLERW